MPHITCSRRLVSRAHSCCSCWQTDSHAVCQQHNRYSCQGSITHVTRFIRRDYRAKSHVERSKQEECRLGLSCLSSSASGDSENIWLLVNTCRSLMITTARGRFTTMLTHRMNSSGDSWFSNTGSDTQRIHVHGILFFPKREDIPSGGWRCPRNYSRSMLLVLSLPVRSTTVQASVRHEDLPQYQQKKDRIKSRFALHI